MLHCHGQLQHASPALHASMHGYTLKEEDYPTKRKFTCAGLVECDGHQRLLAAVEFAGAQVDAAPRLLPGPARRSAARVGRNACLCRVGLLPRAAGRSPAAHGPLLGLRRCHVTGVSLLSF